MGLSAIFEKIALKPMWLPSQTIIRSEIAQFDPTTKVHCITHTMHPGISQGHLFRKL